MVWRRLLRGSPLVLCAYLAVNVLLIVTNPAKFVTQTVDYVGEPVGDRSEDVRLFLANSSDSGAHNSTVRWDIDDTICSFGYVWNTPTGFYGETYDQRYDLCGRRSSVDYFSLEGVDTIFPTGMDKGCGWHSGKWFMTYTFCDEVEKPYMTRHIFNMTLGNFTYRLGLPEGSRASDIEVLLSSTKPAGIYEIASPVAHCEEPYGVRANCDLRADFYYSTGTSFESRKATILVRSQILSELQDLAGGEIMPEWLSKVGMEEGVCAAVASTEELVDCSIDCNASYPYPSSSCVGTFELLLVREIRHKGVIISVMIAAAAACWLSLSTLRLGIRTAYGRSRRGYLGCGGSCQHFFEEEGDRGDRLSLANPVPPMRAVKVSTQGRTTSITFLTFSGSGFPMEKDGEAPAGLGIVVCEGVEKITKDALTKTRTPVALGGPGRTELSSRTGCSGTLPVCFMVRQNPDGSVKNLDVEEAHRLLDKQCGRALMDESFGGDHLAWARGFSVADAVGCLQTLWTVHFVAANSGWGSFYWVAALVALARWSEETDVINLIGSLRSSVRVTPKNRSLAAPPLPITLAVMEVLYDLSIPGVEVLGLVVTALWSLMIVVSCGYFIFFLGYEPVYHGGGVYSRKVSLATALAVGGALNAPFALAGDWVRGSRCGDLGGRLAVSFCLGNPKTSDGERVSHVDLRSELHSSSLETGVLCGDGCCS